MKVLVFTPLSERNGAEMMMWYLMKHANPEQFTFAVYSEVPGPLKSELSATIPYYTSAPIPQVSIPQRVINKLVCTVFRKPPYNVNYWRKGILDIHESFKPDIWYINTVLCPNIANLAHELNIPFVVHFHDLLFIYQQVTYNNLKNMVAGAKLLVGCSKVVCDKLEIMGGKEIALQYECIDIDRVKVDKIVVQKLRESLGIKSSFIWVMSGSVEYRKGTDILPVIARKLGKEVTLIWLGPGSSGYSFYIEQELKYYGLNNVLLLGAKSEDYYNYLALADGLVLTSREDPFPLIMIEAAALGMPIAAFNSGGVKEFVKEGMGIVIDSNNTEDLVLAMNKIMRQEVKLDNAISVSRANDFDVKVQVQSWQELLLQTLSY